MAEALDALFSPTRDALDLALPWNAWKEKKSITGLLADLAMAIRSTSTNIYIGNATTSTTASMGIAEKWN
jgi:hypothetical protein